MLRLEDRVTPAVTSTFDPVYGALTVSSDAADAIVVGSDSLRRVTVNGTAAVDSQGITIESRLIHSLTVSGGPGNNVIDLSGVDRLAYNGLAPTATVIEVMVTAGVSAISISASAVSINGGAGNDTITGSPLGNYIECTSGADVIKPARGENIFIIRNDDISGITITGDPFGHNSLFLDYTPTAGAKMSSNFDVGTGNHTISYGGKSVVCSGMNAVNVQNAIDELDMNLFDSTAGSPGGGGGGTVQITHPPGTDFATIDISPDPNPTSNRWPIKWHNITLKRGITSSMDAWKWRADPSNSPIDIKCTGAGNSLTVNTFGLSSTKTSSSVQVAGMAAVKFTGISSVDTETRLYDTSALIDLKAQGVTVGTKITEGIDGTLTGEVTLTNNGTQPVTGGKVTVSVDKEVWRQDFGQVKADRHDNIRIISTKPGPGVTVEVDENTSSMRIVDLAFGELPEQTIDFSLPDLAPGQSLTNSVTLRKVIGVTKWPNLVLKGGLADRDYEVNLTAFFEKGDRPTQVQFAAVIDSATGTTPGGGATTLIATDATGSVALASSTASAIDPNITVLTAGAHLYLGGRMVDAAPDGTTSGNGATGKAEMSLDGRWVVFESSATNLVTGGSDTNGGSDIFLRDMLLGKTIRVSDSNASAGNLVSFDPHISADGSVIVFRSSATNLVPGVIDNNNAPDLFTATINPATFQCSLACISLVPNTTETANNGVIIADMNGDGINGYTIAYVTEATNAGAPPTPGWHVAVYKQGYPVKWEGPSINATFGAGGLTVSLDGSSVVIWTATDVSNMIGVPDTNGVSDVLDINASTGAVTCLSLNFSGTATADGASPASSLDQGGVVISLDGGDVVFTSTSSNLISGLPAPATDGVYKMKEGSKAMTGKGKRVDTVGASSWGANNQGLNISADGQTISWLSPTNYAATGSSNGHIQVWVKDCYNGTDLRKPAVLVSVSETGAPGNGDSKRGMNGNVRSTADLFSTEATNIVPGDTNGQEDVFASIRHRTFVVRVEDLPPVAAMTLRYDGPSESYQVVDSANPSIVLASQAADGVSAVHIKGRDNVGEVWAVDTTTGLQRLGGNIVIHGGAGAAPDQVSFTGLSGGTTQSAISTRDGVYTITLTRSAPTANFSDGSSRDVTFDALSVQGTDIELIEDKTNASTNKFHNNTLNQVVFSGGDLTLSGGGATVVVKDFQLKTRTATMFLSPGNDSVTINTDGLAAGAAENLEIIGNGGSDTITNTSTFVNAHSGAILNSYDNLQTFVTGGTGDDTLTIGPGNGTLDGGAGNDVYALRARFQPTTTTQTVSIADSSGSDTLDLSDVGMPVNLIMDSLFAQNFMPGNNLQMTGVIENVIGSPFNDVYIVEPLAVPRSIDGGSQVTSLGDRLVVDAKGHSATVISPGQLLVTGFAPINYSNIERLVMVNSAPTLQVALVQVNDGSLQRSRVTSVTLGFNAQVSFPSGPASAISITDDKTGSAVACTVTPADIDGFTHVTITFPAGAPEYGSLPDGKYTLHVLASQVSSGGPLDGNGDGDVSSGGEDYNSPPYLIYRLFGDGNADRIVNQQDFIAFRNAFNNGPSAAFDFEGDGNVTQPDFTQFRNRFNIQL